jgi:hypothetical protein
MISFKEFLLERIQRTYIFEMAFDKQTMENKIRGLENPINLHLVKIIRYEDNTNKQKHINDIMNWLDDIQDLDFNKKNKKFSKELYFKLLFEEPFTDSSNVKYITSLENRKLKAYSELPRNCSLQETLIILERIQREIAKLLSEDSILDIAYSLSKL